MYLKSLHAIVCTSLYSYIGITGIYYSLIGVYVLYNRYFIMDKEYVCNENQGMAT